MTDQAEVENGSAPWGVERDAVAEAVRDEVESLYGRGRYADAAATIAARFTTKKTGGNGWRKIR